MQPFLLQQRKAIALSDLNAFVQAAYDYQFRGHVQGGNGEAQEGGTPRISVSLYAASG
jgi:hypothetical protein